MAFGADPAPSAPAQPTNAERRELFNLQTKYFDRQAEVATAEASLNKAAAAIVAKYHCIAWGPGFTCIQAPANTQVNIPTKAESSPAK